MRYFLLISLMFSCLAFAKEGEPIQDADAIIEISGYFSEQQASVIGEAFREGDDDLVIKLLHNAAKNPAFSPEEVTAMRKNRTDWETCTKCKCSTSGRSSTKTCTTWKPGRDGNGIPGTIRFRQCDPIETSKVCPSAWDRFWGAVLP